jgi:hypothetical protein
MGKGGKGCELCQQPINLKYAKTSVLVACLFQITQLLFAAVLEETLTQAAAVRNSLTSAPRHPDDPSALQEDKRDLLPPEFPGSPNTRASCCANLASCISNFRFTSISGNNNRKTATAESPIEFGSNVVRKYAIHRKKTRSAG